MLRAISNSKTAKIVAVFLAMNITAEILAPNLAFALTGGPSQPEVQSFEPIGTSEMVDLFSGDFTYNIPLLDVDGYPVNISYNSGVGMDQEASWVGLGWNINPGAITRNMRGIPDDFNGDKVVKTTNMKPNRTYGASGTFGSELFGTNGLLTLSYGIGINYSNYNGVGFDQMVNASFASGKGGKGPWNADLGITSGADGLSLNPSVSYGKKLNDKAKGDNDGSMKGKIGLSLNSRAGLRALNLKLTASAGSIGGTVKTKKAIKSIAAALSGSNGGASISFGTATYTPSVSQSMINSSITVSVKTGGTLFGLDGSWDLSGYYSEQRLAEPSQNIYAYGYLNSDAGSNSLNSMLDFNREKDGSFTQNTPNLPVTNFTYDVYSVAGQGIGGMYRPYRSDVGYVYDPASFTYSMSGSLGAELDGGNLFHGGVDVSVTDVMTTSGAWVDDNPAASSLRFKKTTSDPLYEPYYFKEAGEKTVDPDPLYASVGYGDPVRVKLKSWGGLFVKTESKFEKNTGSPISIPATNYRTHRQKRNQAITLMTASEASSFGLQTDIKNYPENTFLNATPSSVSRYTTGSGAIRKSHHVSEITTLRTDGSRYVFGLAAYNNLQKEVTFNASGRTTDCNTGLVTYATGDNSLSNARGIDNYYSSTETPAYAHSYLLTAVLSPDYVDYDAIPGPSDGDHGTYTRFNYTRSNDQYQWRVPLGTNKANFNEGLKSDPDDNQGNYVYGEKEVWYLHSIETRNYIAEFTLANRDDGYGVTGEDGTVGGSPLKKLVKISLYSKADRKANGMLAVPVKEVHFEYDYSLCKGIPNNLNVNPLDPTTGGKLTLKKIYFTYGKSYKGKLSPYEFVYADPTHDGIEDNGYNPNYNLKGYDSWGNYKPNNGGASCDVSDPLTTSEYPYVEQDRTTADQYTQAWALTSIHLPSGGTINIDFESDDYAYVQDKQAMQMFKITGIGDDPATDDPSAAVNNRLMTSGNSTNRYLYFELHTPLPSSSYTATTARDYITANYLNGITDLYFRFLVDMTKAGDWEYVSGYLDIADYGVVSNSAFMPNSEYTYGYIKLDPVCSGDPDDNTCLTSNKVHPISKAAWQFGRLHTPKKVWDQPSVTDPGIEQVLTAISNSSFAQNIEQLFKGPNKYIRDKGYGKSVYVDKCWIKMLSPEKKKLGGGSRVKQVAISDNWDNMVSGQSKFSYGQVYEYTTTEASTGRTISSGVASYEPAAGGDENPFRRPVYFSAEKRLVPDDESYLEEPFGESFFPSPSVGYSKVLVKNIQYANVKRHATGHVIHEFYTAKDFPTLTKQTGLEAKRKKTNPILGLFGISMKDYMTASQGYVIELNDMHGKPKAQWIYAENQDVPISGVEYFYKTDASNSKQLDNAVYAINKTGDVSIKTVGLDFDIVADMREHKTDIVSTSLNGNLAGFLAAVLPLTVPTLLPGMNKEKTRFRSAVVTKVINRYGILEKTIAHDVGHTVSTENLAYDYETGEVLVTKTKNDFEDAIYSFTYPAHWSYDRMGPAYQNIGAQFPAVTFSSGVATVPNGNQVFAKGDELALNSTSRGWVCDVVNGVGTGGADATITVIDADGDLISGSNSLKIIRSGRRNMQVTPVGNITTRTNPLVDTSFPADGIYDEISFTDVLDASAAEFSENWQMKFGYTETSSCSCDQTSISSALETFLSTMTTNGVLTSSSVNVYNSPNYYHGYSSTLHNELGILASSAQWGASITDNILTGVIDCIDCEPSCSGSVTLMLPPEYSWSNVTALEGLTMVSATNPECASINGFTVTATIQTGESTQSVVIYGTTSSCWPIGTCTPATPTTTQCGKIAGDIVNPYFEGLRGNWRPLRSHTYLADRSQTSATNNNLDIRKDGTIITYDLNNNNQIAFQPFWNPNVGNDWTKDANYWTWVSEVTRYNSLGQEVENKDALGRYSAAVYGYNQTLPIAVASNAKYNEIAYDGFEDYGYYNLADCQKQHFNFLQNGVTRWSIAHTGNYSLRLFSGQSITATRPLTSVACTTSADNCSYTLKSCDDLKTFSPETYNGTQKYVLSVWVKEHVTTPPVFTYDDATVTVSVGGFPVVPLSTTKSDIIEGWQRVELVFEIAAAATGNIDITLSYNGAATAFFDDLRIHPFNSNMKSFVYNPRDLRYVAALDENNYATFYEYDEEGALVRVKKETERGIVTLQENRNSKAK